MYKSLLVFIVSITMSAQSFGQNSTTVDDTLESVRMMNTIEQSLQAFYAEYGKNPNYDSLLQVLNYEEDSIPLFSDEVYCERLAELNEKSPFHLDCNEATLKTIHFFARKRRNFIKLVLGRKDLYFDMYEAKLSEYDMPIELKYLSVIESGLRPQVRSRAGAMGLWQFMYATGRMFGLTEDSYVDERMDPAKATDAACRYLKKLYEMYGDWNLALAAYNAGPGNVNKAIRRSGGKKTYWEIRPYLPRETQGYVPNFIAASYMIEYHVEHNITPIESKVKYHELDTMCLNQGVHFQTISSILEIDIEEVEVLNPTYKRAYIPKANPPYCVQLPITEIGKLVSLEDSLYQHEMTLYNYKTDSTGATQVDNPTANKPQMYVYHKVDSSESIHTIAKKYKTTVAEIQRDNGLDNAKVYVGQRLKVKKGENTTTTRTTTTPSGGRKYYTVRSGDTFGAIASRHGKSINSLRRLNPGINISRLRIGQKIRIR